jgi:hypothetical protein
MNNSFIIGKLYCCINESDILALNERQYTNNLIPYIARLEKLNSINARHFSGNVDFVVLKQDSILLLIDIHMKPLAGITYTIFKCLYEDKIIYIPFSKKKPEECLIPFS